MTYDKMMSDASAKVPTVKGTLAETTRVLLHIAARSHTLRDKMGIGLDEAGRLEMKVGWRRAWLTPHPIRTSEYSFNPDIFAGHLKSCSDGEDHLIRFLLNVWNPHYARTQEWEFDLFEALRTLDQGNREAIAWWLKNPIWP